MTLDPARLVGVLDDVAPRMPVLPPVAVRPYVFHLADRPILHPNVEVATAHWVPLAELSQAEARRLVSIEVRGVVREEPAFVVSAGVVWGMTHRILQMLADT